MCPYKDKTKMRVKCRKITIEEARWDMFDEAKRLAEKELGQIGNGTFLEILITNWLQMKQTEDEYRLNKTTSQKSK